MGNTLYGIGWICHWAPARPVASRWFSTSLVHSARIAGAFSRSDCVRG